MDHLRILMTVIIVGLRNPRNSKTRSQKGTLAQKKTPKYTSLFLRPFSLSFEVWLVKPKSSATTERPAHSIVIYFHLLSLIYTNNILLAPFFSFDLPPLDEIIAYFSIGYYYWFDCWQRCEVVGNFFLNNFLSRGANEIECPSPRTHPTLPNLKSVNISKCWNLSDACQKLKETAERTSKRSSKYA